MTGATKRHMPTFRATWKINIPAKPMATREENLDGAFSPT